MPFLLDKIVLFQISYPLVTVSNVFVFPGIPFLLRKSFENIAVDLIIDSLGGEASALPAASTAQVYVTDSEWFITDRLNEIVEKHPAVTIGSYPEWTHNYFKVTN